MAPIQPHGTGHDAEGAQGFVVGVELGGALQEGFGGAGFEAVEIHHAQPQEGVGVGGIEGQDPRQGGGGAVGLALQGLGEGQGVEVIEVAGILPQPGCTDGGTVAQVHLVGIGLVELADAGKQGIELAGPQLLAELAQDGNAVGGQGRRLRWLVDAGRNLDGWGRHPQGQDLAHWRDQLGLKLISARG